jgi:hypothetical protein
MRTGEDEANEIEDELIKELRDGDESDSPESMSEELTTLQRYAILEVAQKEKWIMAPIRRVSQRILHLWLSPSETDKYGNAWRCESLWYAWYWTKNVVKKRFLFEATKYG